MSFDGVSGTLTVAAVQATPVFLDRAATVDVVAFHVASADADLVVFPESFVPGYPDWVWRRSPMSDGDWYARLVANAVRVDGTDLDPVRDAARDAGATVAVGVTERSRSDTLYNTVVYIGPTGEIAGRHRKLVPTGAERLIWANGNDHLLTVIEVEGVKVGSLICWENYMPLARMAMYERGIDVLLAPTWDNSDEWVPTLRHIAKEGQIFVVGVTALLRGSDVPRDLSDSDELYGGEDDFMSRGNTTIVAPGGELVAGPLIGESGRRVRRAPTVAHRRRSPYVRPHRSLRPTRRAVASPTRARRSSSTMTYGCMVEHGLSSTFVPGAGHLLTSGSYGQRWPSTPTRFSNSHDTRH